jgi:hypothetical protein
VTDSGRAAMRPEDDPGWHGYADTILEVHLVPPQEIDLAQPVTERERAIWREAGLQGAFGLVTPDNPFGQPMAEAVNAERRERFWAELHGRGVQPVRVDGLSRDRQHREIGVALPWSCDEVVELARRWDQSAIYWFDGAAMWVIGALTQAPPWRLEGR